ncbi:NUDIX domain-containing protein [Streptomyces sp. DvalAA-14]|uniref:methyltransferase domain-containing protein n=1 Tax=unclassified Streptomyces TaxID=2593676 RepID=UPI00081B22B3|nr:MULTISPECIES: methyltransferase domain-containing protein [unclassified Streptomyces]MYS20530.1 methyltransferase domain-containing protein [Streptomyces sp. SID4948]SCD71130.1 NUDIX domain-containing protein [Streptomyces sp. DvalAA-14]
MNTESDDRRFWDAAAERFDEEPDHGLRDPLVREAWAQRLRSWLPAGPSDVLDLGCGTGSLALLAAEQGHRVTAVDRSPRMVESARRKLAGTGARTLVGDAARPPVAAVAFDVVLVRHVLWTLPDAESVLRGWARLLRPGGRLVLVEGRWGTSAPVGLTAESLAESAAPLGGAIRIEHLGQDAALWGRPVDDERYVAVVHPADTAAPAVPRRHREIVDVHLLLVRGERILLARRANTGYADGLLHAPSGHLEDGEDVRSAMIRETREEIGLDLAPDDLEAVLVLQHRAPGGDARIGWFFLCHLAAGTEPVNAEPDKCSELDWYPLADLPDDMVAYARAGIEAWRAGHRFLLHLHEGGDTIAHDPDGPVRAVPLAPPAVPGSLI